MKKPKFRQRILVATALAALLTPSIATAQFEIGLELYYQFDGDSLDSSGNNRHGTVVNTDLSSTETYEATDGLTTVDLEPLFNNGLEDTFLDASFGQGISLDGFEQYVQVDGGASPIAEDAMDFMGGDVTISAWVQVPFGFINNNSTIAAKGDGDNYGLARQGGELFGVATGGGFSAAGGPVLDDSLAHHVAAVIEAGVGGGVRLYVDGVLASSTPGDAQIPDSLNFLLIGANPALLTADPFASPSSWEGVIDDLAIWSRVLSAGEISTIYNGGTGVTIANILNPVDSDNDGMPDFYESANGLDPNDDTGDEGASGDKDGDTLTNIQEYNGDGIVDFDGGTKPNVADSDLDGADDAQELNGTLNTDFGNARTDPTNPDSDGDGVIDGEEMSGVLNTAFNNEATDPNVADTDDDDFTDRDELAFETDPNDPLSLPSSWQIGLKAYWPLDKQGYLDSGTDFSDRVYPDESGLGMDASFDPPLTADSEALFFGGKLHADSIRFNTSITGQLLTVLNDVGSPTPLSCQGGDITIAGWFRTPAFNTNWQCLIAKGEGTNWRIHRRGGDQNPATLTYAGGVGEGGAAGPDVDDFQWHHFVAISEAGVSTRLYVDGNLTVTGGVPNLNDNGLPVQIGGNPDAAGRTWTGQIEEIGIWGRPLDDAEIGLLWNGGNGAKISDLIEGLDSDGDGMIDLYELANGLDPNSDVGDDGAMGDPDLDLLFNIDEQANGTDPQNPDSDADGLNDGPEVTGSANTAFSDEPTDPKDADSDSDGALDGAEITAMTDPNNPDTDGDGFKDGEELSGGSDPLDAGSKPPIETSLVAYFPLDGNFNDTDPNSPGVHNGTFFGSPASFVPAQFGDGIDLNGTDQYIAIGGPESDIEFVGGDMTVSVWFSTAPFSRTWQCLIGKGEGNSWRIHRHGNNANMTFTGGNGDIEGAFLTGTPDPQDGAMHHLVAITEGGISQRLYIDGVKVGDEPNPNLVSQNNNPGRIGDNAGATGRFWQGRVDDVAIWGRALNEAEIALIWNSGCGASIQDVIDGTIPPCVPMAAGVTLTDVGFNIFGGFEVTASGLDPARTYELRRYVQPNSPAVVPAPELDNWVVVAAAGTISGVTEHIFADSTAPVPDPGETVTYIVREAAP